MGLHYRATMTALTVGQNPGIKAYNYSDDPERKVLEDFLENKRPSESCSRLTSWFACDSPANSAKYLEAELGRQKQTGTIGQARLYAIKVETFSRQPMILVNAVNTALAGGDSITAEMLADEYWRPTRGWKFWEYTAPGILIIEEVNWPDAMAQSLAFMAYQGDDVRLKRMLASR